MLIYQKGSDNFRDEPDLKVKPFKTRLDLLRYALDTGIKLHPRESVQIWNGLTGEEERGTLDARAEIELLERELVKEEV